MTLAAFAAGVDVAGAAAIGAGALGADAGTAAFGVTAGFWFVTTTVCVPTLTGDSVLRCNNNHKHIASAMAQIIRILFLMVR